MAIKRDDEADGGYGEKSADARVIIEYLNGEKLLEKNKARIAPKGTLKEIIEGTWEGYITKIPQVEEMKNIIKSVNDDDIVLEKIINSLPNNNLKENGQKPSVNNIIGKRVDYKPSEPPLLLNWFGIPQNKTATYMEMADIQQQNRTGKYLRTAFLTTALLLLSNTTCTKPYNEGQISKFVTSISRDYNYIKDNVRYEKAKGFLGKIADGLKKIRRRK